MNNYDVNACLNTFSQLCDDTERSELVSAEECQYWVFEAGYMAAMQVMMNTISSGKTDNVTSHLEEAIKNRLTLH